MHTNPSKTCATLLLNDQRQLTMEDFGAGSRVKKNNVRSVDDIAHSSLKPKKFGQLLFRIVDAYAPRNILELGTSLGITTAYLASAKKDTLWLQWKGPKPLLISCENNFSKLGLKILNCRG
jgi:predicted O-methyltransferase YrrM